MRYCRRSRLERQRTINRGLTFLAKDNLAWKEKRKCAECHHAPFTIWALSEGKKQGYAVDEKALADMTAWVLTKDQLAKLVAKPPKREQIELNEAPLLLALGIEAGDATARRRPEANAHLGRERSGQGRLVEAGLEWRLPIAGASTTALLGARLSQSPLLSASALFPGRVWSFRPIGSSPDTLTALALLALSAPNAPDMGKEAKAAREKGLKWLRAARSDDELQASALRLILWRRLGLPATEWEPLAKRIRWPERRRRLGPDREGKERRLRHRAGSSTPWPRPG